MDFLELAARRCSIRNFSDRQIEQDKMDRILEAARLAPTGANLQPQKIYVLQSEEAIKKIRGLTECAFNAPTVLLVTYDKNKEWKNALEEGYSCGQQDASIVAAHMMLEACELGLSSCWVNVFPPTKLMQAFGLLKI